MTRISLFHFVICMPLVAGLVFAVYSYRASSILTRFNEAVDNDIWSFKYGDLAFVLGESKAREIVESKAAESDKLYYDGETRIIQIIERKHRHYKGKSDRVALYTFGEENGSWIGPIGMRVDSVSFKKSEVQVAIYGDLKWESRSISVPRNESLTFPIPWGENAKPSHGDFSTMILEHFYFQE